MRYALLVIATLVLVNGLSVQASPPVLQLTPTDARTPTTLIAARLPIVRKAGTAVPFTPTTVPPSPTITTTPTPSRVPTLLITNGDFEQGATGWTAQTEGIGMPPVGIPAHSGSYIATFSDVGQEQKITHRVTIPFDVSYLTYWAWIDSAETACGLDSGGVVLAPDSGSGLDIIGEVNSLCVRTTTDGWVRHSIYIQPLAGKTATLIVLTSTFDTTPNSKMYIDDVGLQSGL